MATSASRRPQLLVDTSVAVALAVADHSAHRATEYRLPLATRDRRALEIYRALDVEVQLLA